MSVNATLILFAKAPVIGEVKTRMSPPLSLSQAAELAEALLEETLKLVSKCWQGRLVLAVSPSQEHPAFKRLASLYSVELITQEGENLGERMRNAMNVIGYPCAVMGCDVPHCSPNILKTVYNALCQGNSCIGETLDGGYYLLGLQESHPQLFYTVNWGTGSVYEATMKVAETVNLVFVNLEKLQDIDYYADLEAASKKLPRLLEFLI